MPTPPEGFEISELENTEVGEELKRCIHSLVGLCCVSYPVNFGNDLKNELKSHFFSGFVFEYADKWYWMTAGHILEEIELTLNHANYVLRDFALLDHFGPGELNKMAIPFDYASAWKYYEYDTSKGLDYGIVELREHDKRLMRLNNVPAITIAEWEDAATFTYIGHFMAGLPLDAVESHIRSNQDVAVISSRTCPSVMYLEMQTETQFGDTQTEYPRIVSKLSPNWPEGDIKGMSGGPVFGICKETNEYRIVGIQSSWRARERVAFATPLQVAGPKCVQAILDRCEAEKGLG